ncbi:MAG: hypothetical protein ABIJ96_08200 [Elusimicrobiota bacterium]
MRSSIIAGALLLLGAAPATAQDRRACIQLAKASTTRLAAAQRARAARAPDPVFPEDGSLPLRAWFTSPPKSADVVNTRTLTRILEAQGAALCDIGYDYEWIQDIAIFTASGRLLLQAEMPPDQDILVGVTEGVLNQDQYGIDPLRLTRSHARALKLPYRRMRWTFVEGGEMITGRFPNGRTYAIIDQDAVDRTRAYHEFLLDQPLSERKARRLIARDLGISPRDLFPVPSGGEHLDLLIMALPGGVLLMQDYAQTVPVLNTLLSGDLPPAERRRLKAMRKFHQRGTFYSDLLIPELEDFDPASPMRLRPYDAAEEEQRLNRIAAALPKSFQIVRVAGIFKEYNDEAEYWEDDKEPLLDQINFFNGFVGANSRKSLTVITNAAQGLSSLESYWRKILSRHGVAPEHAHFLGSFYNGAGIDCAGAPSG